MASARRLTIPYAPRRVFLPYHRRTARWAALVAHRRCGKTVACVNDILPRALTNPLADGRYAYVAPYYSQAKDIAWSYLKRFSAPVLAREPNESELWVEILNGARIRLYGADNPDRLRGAYLDGIVLDEYADMRPWVWGEIVRPMLADRKGWATFIGTPKGRNDFHAICETARASPDWFFASLPASGTGILDREELDAARRDMTPEQYEQEFECSFDAAILGAYYSNEIAEAERNGRFVDLAYDPLLPVNLAWDLGIGDSTAIWVFQAVRNEIRVLDFYENSGFALEHYVTVLEGRGWRGTDWLPHDARVRELGTGRTRVETLTSMGRKIALVPAHGVEDGINAGRLALPLAWFNRRTTAAGVEALRQYRAEYDEKTKAFRNAPRHDWTSHAADAWRYLAMVWRAMTPVAPAKPKPIGVALNALTYNELHDLTGLNRPQRRRV